MICSPWRCLPALVAVFCISAAADAAESSCAATFPGPAGEVQSAAFAIGDGRHYVAVALSGVQADGGKLRSDGRVLPAELFVDPVSRLVIFRVDGPPGRALALGRSRISAGMELKARGGSAGRTTGWVKQINGKMLPLSLLKVEYGGAAPSAGTPLLNSAGVVVAIAHQTTAPKAGYAIPAEVVKRVLEDVQGGGKVSRGWIGLKLLPQSTTPQVTQVQDGSPSAQAGIQAGDVLLEVGTRPLADYADAVNAFYFLRPGVPSALRVKRGEKEISVSVTPVERRGE
jgi:S1-C subfamily serine protease